MEGPEADKFRPEFVVRGDAARLIPPYADTSKELRVTTTFLATMGAVDEFGRSLLKMLGAPAPKTARIHGYTEVQLTAENSKKSRPDGLIHVSTGRSRWSALVEAKVGTAELAKEQLEDYLGVARANGIDAVVTISNQFAPLPTHHPVQVSRSKTRKVDLYHWSWTSILAEAIIVAGHKGIADPDQAFILGEFIRYLEHDGSGVNPFPKIGQGWKEVSRSVRHGVRPPKRELEDTVGEWQQLSRFLALRLGMFLERTVSENIPRSHMADADTRLHDNCNEFLKTSILETEFNVPNAASSIKVALNLNRRTISFSTELRAPTDRSRATSLVTWIVSQLSECDDGNIMVKAMWPGRTADTCASLGELRENKKAVLTSNLSFLPRAFELIRVLDVKSRIGSRGFVEEITAALPNFYRDVGQHLKAWVPPAPRVKESERREAEGESPAAAGQQPAKDAP